MPEGEEAEQPRRQEEQQSDGFVFPVHQAALPLDLRPQLRADHEPGNAEEQHPHVLGQVLVAGEDRPGEGIDQEQGNEDRAGAAQGRKPHCLHCPPLLHHPLAGQGGEGRLRVGSAQKDGGNGIKERLGDAGGEDDASHLEGRESPGQKLRRHGQEHGCEVVEVQAGSEAADDSQEGAGGNAGEEGDVGHLYFKKRL